MSTTNGIAALACCGLLLLASASVSQTQLFDISTASVHPILMPDAPDYTFGVEMDPDGLHCYVTVSGALANPGTTGFLNNRLLKIRMDTGVIVGQAIVGFYPEDIVLRLDANGQTETIFVSNTSSGTVTALDANLTVLQSANLGSCFGFPMFPFEMALSQNGATLYVGSNCAGDLFALDADPLSANFMTVTTVATWGESHNTVDLLPSDPNTLVVGGSVADFDPAFNFLGTHSTVDLVDLGGPAPSIQSFQVGAAVTGDFASTTDVVPMSGGRLLVVENSQTRANLYLVDSVTGAILRTYDLSIQVPGLAFLHQADVDVAERVACVTSLSADIIYLDLVTGNVLGRTTLPGSPQPSVPRFTLDGTRVVVTFQNEESVRIYGALPAPLSGAIVGNPVIGGALGFSFVDATPQVPVGILFSATGAGPTLAFGHFFALGQPFGLAFLALADAAGNASYAVAIPNDPALAGAVGNFQGVTVRPNGRIALSEPLVVTVGI